MNHSRSEELQTKGAKDELLSSREENPAK